MHDRMLTRVKVSVPTTVSSAGGDDRAMKLSSFPLWLLPLFFSDYIDDKVFVLSNKAYMIIMNEIAMLVS